MIIAGDMGLYFGVMILTLIIGGGAQLYVTSQLRKYSHVPSSYGVTGAEMARRMSVDKGISHVGILRGGPNQDFFDPRSNSVTLGTEAYGQYSITAIATAVHEMGHASQYAEGYAFMKFRSALVPVVNFCSNAWMIIFMLGLLMGAAGGTTLMKVGIIMFAAVLLFQLVTLPVEFDASRRGLAYLQATGMNQAELSGAYSVLRACALTYVAAALTALLQLLYMVLSTRSED
ncbi:zinc metallopeptidase [Slackia piriformis]|uniref:Neutral zinc metallopeptidase n=1 Tax=Slackia piriformis YIT 12062 TaxID=742818 RepID=K0YWY8_9ACTN|nr:zinc metallopeptidase [Slackia piriformis]EJZ84019.1 hypothetical protein HMPREF9451_00728 [Slackia piriformis YIT 12062]MDO5024641.1 zinc metallopeptidase [Slackia piriformis]